jgi:hypothetical protein
MNKSQRQTFEIAACYGGEQLSSCTKTNLYCRVTCQNSTIIKILKRKPAIQKTFSNYCRFFTQNILYPEICYGYDCNILLNKSQVIHVCDDGLRLTIQNVWNTKWNEWF